MVFILYLDTLTVNSPLLKINKKSTRLFHTCPDIEYNSNDFQIQSFSQNPRLRSSDYELTENRGRLGMPPFRLSLDSSDEDSSMSSSFGQVNHILFPFSLIVKVYA